MREQTRGHSQGLQVGRGQWESIGSGTVGQRGWSEGEEKGSE